MSQEREERTRNEVYGWIKANASRWRAHNVWIPQDRDDVVVRLVAPPITFDVPALPPEARSAVPLLESLKELEGTISIFCEQVSGFVRTVLQSPPSEFRVEEGPGRELVATARGLLAAFSSTGFHDADHVCSLLREFVGDPDAYEGEQFGVLCQTLREWWSGLSAPQ